MHRTPVLQSIVHKIKCMVDPRLWEQNFVSTGSKERDEHKRTLAEQTQRNFYYEKQDTSTRRQSQYFGNETLVQCSRSFFSENGNNAGVRPVVLRYDPGNLFSSLYTRFHDLKAQNEDNSLVFHD